jgi:hypothetical protein
MRWSALAIGLFVAGPLHQAGTPAWSWWTLYLTCHAPEAESLVIAFIGHKSQLTLQPAISVSVGVLVTVLATSFPFRLRSRLSKTLVASSPTSARQRFRLTT